MFQRNMFFHCIINIVPLNGGFRSRAIHIQSSFLHDSIQDSRASNLQRGDITVTSVPALFLVKGTPDIGHQPLFEPLFI